MLNEIREFKVHAPMKTKSIQTAILFLIENWTCFVLTVTIHSHVSSSTLLLSY